jgi:hypothetical protein
MFEIALKKMKEKKCNRLGIANQRPIFYALGPTWRCGMS